MIAYDVKRIEIAYAKGCVYMSAEYTRGKPMDKERLAQYLEMAKGERTMKQFAEECGVNPSTFSRIANKKFTGASSETLMRAIFDHAVPNCGFTLDELMDANGMVPAGRVQITGYPYQELVVNDLITSEITRRVGATVCLRKKLRLSKTMGYTPDILCESESFHGNGMWALDIIFASHFASRRDGDASDKQFDKIRNRMMNRRRFFDRLARYATIGYFHPEEVPQRFSFIVLDKNFFEDIVMEYGEQKFQGDVSLVLIDVNNLKVTDEFVFQRRDGNTMEKFFTVPAEEGALGDEEGLIDIDDI